MSADGSTVFFTTTNQLLGADTDSSADLYSAHVDSARQRRPQPADPGRRARLQPGCQLRRPALELDRRDGDLRCGPGRRRWRGRPVNGSIYVLSPQQLDGSAGTADQPNLYIVEPGGAPQFVATLEPSNPLVLDSVARSGKREDRRLPDHSGRAFAVFPSSLALTGVGNFGFRSIFRYDADTEQLDCVSCDPSGTTDSSLADDAHPRARRG